jgi:hypothetical protein
MRMYILLAAAVVILGVSYAVGSALIRGSSTSPIPAVSATAATLSPHEIHLNYKRMKELPVHDVKDAF